VPGGRRGGYLREREIRSDRFSPPEAEAPSEFGYSVIYSLHSPTPVAKPVRLTRDGIAAFHGGG